MDVILETCAGLDVHQETVVTCVLKGPLDKKPKPEVRTFGTTTAELLQLQDWLNERECIEVAMESTGVLWKPIWNILEDTCRLTLANPAKIKNMPGKKTDVKDAVWIAQLHRCGLIEGSFVPEEKIRDLRDLTRYRRKMKPIHNLKERNYVCPLFEGSTIYLQEIEHPASNIQAAIEGEIDFRKAFICKPPLYHFELNFIMERLHLPT
ncbi:transposase [Paenibacillus filicis]|uniref:Transposase n=1 Tax=Paenibacillus gyeongsangnamensis TaxID=3388067 RepID=A0ABT4Q4F2_9BACL|nr:transposase [Paenibacillus filicis]MCZ8511686.1 transposase [Paenibacillus filicis]